MSREIKFRAWNTNDNTLYSNMQLSDLHNGTPLNDIFKVGDVIFMQYTGLKDKNGVEIFEGDIVSIRFRSAGEAEGFDYENGIIKWLQSSSAFKWFSLEDDPSDANNYWLSQADEHEREIIGNIYENPDLLPGHKEGKG